LAVALAGHLRSGLTGYYSSSRYITGAYLLAIGVPFYAFFVFNDLSISSHGSSFDSGILNIGELLKNIESRTIKRNAVSV
jgi:hypothetical protein